MMTKHWMTTTAMAGVLGLSGLCMGADFSGNWIAQTATQGEPQYTRVSLKVDGTTVSGVWGESKIDGTLTGGKLDIKLSGSDGNPAGTLIATLAGDTFTGSGTISRARGGRGGGGRGGGGGGRGGQTNFTLARAAVPPAT